MKLFLLSFIALLISTVVAAPNAPGDIKHMPSRNIRRTVITNMLLQKRGCDMAKCLAAAGKLGFDCAKALIKEGKSLKDDIKCAIDIGKMIRKYKKHECDDCIAELKKDIRRWRRKHRTMSLTTPETFTFSGTSFTLSFSDYGYYLPYGSSLPVTPTTTTTPHSSPSPTTPTPTTPSPSTPTPRSTLTRAGPMTAVAD